MDSFDCIKDSYFGISLILLFLFLIIGGDYIFSWISLEFYEWIV